MAPLSDPQRQRNETAIRAAIDRLLAGHLPPGGRCDLKTLAREAGVTRTGFYPKGDRPGPYQHLADEFHRRLNDARAAGDQPDPRDAQLDRLREQNQTLHRRLADAQATIDQLTAVKTLAISQLAALHDEIHQLRTHAHQPTNVRPLHPARR
jgi:hypothetical protein